MPAHQVFPSSPEWNYVKFRIQLLTGRQNIQLEKITKIPVQFDSTCDDCFKIDAAIDATTISEQKVQSFRIKTQRQSIFQSGYIEPRKIDGNQHRMLLFKLAIGKTMAVYKDTRSNVDLTFPQDIDTIYLSDKQEELCLFSHQYRVKNPKQYSLEYDVVYRFTDKVSNNSQFETFDFRREVPINTQKQYEKMDAQQFSAVFINKQKSVLQEIKNKLFLQIRMVQQKIEHINSEYEFKEKELEERFSNKLLKLREDATKQVTFAVGLHIELRRKYDEYLWVEKFLQHAESILPTQENLKMKEAFVIYIENNYAKENFLRMDKIISLL